MEKGIPLEHYVKYRSVAQLDCLKHLKEHKISWYVVFSIPGFFDTLYTLPRDEFELYFGDDVNLFEIQRKYNNSPKTQNFLYRVQKIISLYIEKENKKDK